MQHVIPPQKAHGALVRTTALVGSAALASRVLGFVRDMSMAWLLGGSLAADALVLALRLPNVLRRLLGEGALSMSLTAELSRGGTCPDILAPNEIFFLSRAVALRLCLLLGMGTALGVCFAGPLAVLLAPGQAHDALFMAEALPLLRLTLPYALFAGMAALSMATLHALGRFLLPALLPAFFNIVVLLFALLAALNVAPATWLLACGVLCGGFVQWLIPWWALRRLRSLSLVSSVPSYSSPDAPQLRERARQCLARLPLGVLGAAAPQLSMLGAMVTASWLPDGSVAALYYAERLMELPLGVAGAALGVASLPALAQWAARNNHLAMVEEASHALRLSICITLPSTAGLLAVALPLVQVLFARGAFDQQAVTATTMALWGYAPGLAAYGLTRPLLALCHALGLVRQTAVSALLAVALAFGASCMLTAVLPPSLVMLGPPLGVSLGLWGQAGHLFLLSRRELKVEGLGIGLLCFVQHCVSALVTGLVAFGLATLPLPGAPLLLLAVGAGVLACGVSLRLLANAEFAEIWGHFRRGNAGLGSEAKGQSADTVSTINKNK